MARLPLCIGMSVGRLPITLMGIRADGPVIHQEVKSVTKFEVCRSPSQR